MVNNIENAKESSHLLINAYSQAVLQCCKKLLHNAFTAREFYENGGIRLLVCLLKLKPELPPQTMITVVECIEKAVVHYEIAAAILDSPLIQTVDQGVNSATDIDNTSAYQSLLNLMLDIKSNSPVATVCRRVINWIAIIDSLQKLHSATQAGCYVYVFI